MKPLTKIITIHLGVVLLIAGYYALLSILDISCPIRAIFGHPCPACGMTRACLSLLKLDFAGYWRYNPTALPCAAAVLFAVHKKSLFKKINPRIIDIAVIALAILVFAVYIIRLNGNNIP